MAINVLSTTPTNSKSDLFGALASGLCMIHCLATPLLFVVQAASCSDTGPLWWRMLDYVFLVVSIVAIYYSAKATSVEWMPRAMYVCWGVLAVLLFNERLHLLPIPHILMYLPAIGLIILHLYNRKYDRCEAKECCSSEQFV